MDTKVKIATGRTLMVLALSVAFTAGCSRNPANVFQGYIEGEYVYVASPLGGALTNLAVARGDEVKSGQLLLTLERQSEASRRRRSAKKPGASKGQLRAFR
jgi:HlyD family secretion protein